MMSQQNLEMCNQIQQFVDVCTMFHTCYEVNASLQWSVSNYNVVHVCYDDCTMLQHCVMMYWQSVNNVLTMFPNVSKCTTTCDVISQWHNNVTMFRWCLLMLH